jgi:metallo-beta-lactamase class B
MGMAGKIASLALAAGLIVTTGAGAAAPTTEAQDIARARQLAGTQFAGSMFLCENNLPIVKVALEGSKQWLPPTRAFDNLYYIGNAFVGVWVLKTSAGLILLDSLQSEAEVREQLEPGLRTLGFDPADIKYALITHGHWDHYGGAKYLQERYGTRIGLSAADWDMLGRLPPGGPERAPMFGPDRADRVPPKRDFVITDGQRLTLGDTTVALYVTPGHTPGTLSALIPAREGGRTHMLSLLGGTAFPPTRQPSATMAGIDAFKASVHRLAALSAQAHADSLINTHIFVDGSDKRLAAAALRKPGDPNPFVLGEAAVQRYYGMFEACLDAAAKRPPKSQAEQLKALREMGGAH